MGVRRFHCCPSVAPYGFISSVHFGSRLSLLSTFGSRRVSLAERFLSSFFLGDDESCPCILWNRSLAKHEAAMRLALS